MFTHFIHRGIARVEKLRYTEGTVVPLMLSCFQKRSSKNTDRLVRMRKLISQEHCRSAMRGSSWSLLDRFLHRGMRMLLFHRDLAALRESAKSALRRDLDADGDLSKSPFLYLEIELSIWSLRWKSVVFVLGFEMDATSALDLLIPPSRTVSTIAV